MFQKVSFTPARVLFASGYTAVPGSGRRAAAGRAVPAGGQRAAAGTGAARLGSSSDARVPPASARELVTVTAGDRNGTLGLFSAENHTKPV